ncbi:MAG: preprotein translocase subunit SecG [Anaerolineae bacterium]
MDTYLYLAQIIVALALIVAILLQAKGGGLSGIFGGDGTTYRSRRGIERTLYHATIGLAVGFFALSVVTVVFVR